MNGKLSLGIATAVLAVAFGGTAMAQFPENLKTGGQPQSSNALVTINIPAVVGIDVEHNFVLSPGAAGTGCWGSAGAAFPMTPGVGDTNFTFAVNNTGIASTLDVACPGSGANQLDKATVKVFSTASGTSTLKAKITDGGFGTSSGTKLSDLVPGILTGGKLSLIDSGDSDTCGHLAGKAFPVSLATTDNSLVTAIPATPFASCRQKLQLVLNTDTTAYAAGVATAKLTYTMTTP